MRSLTEHLVRYGAVHRDRRNLATHAVGIPMIVLAGLTGLAGVGVDLGGWTLTPAHALVAGALGFYLALDVSLGLLMAALAAPTLWLATRLAADPVTWLAVGGGGFVAGWALQLVGHVWEGRKPAFLDDLVGLLEGPLFLVVEALFVVGLRAELRDAVHAQVGPTR